MARFWVHSLQAHSPVAYVMPLASKVLATRNICSTLVGCTKSRSSSVISLRSTATTISVRPPPSSSRFAGRFVGHSSSTMYSTGLSIPTVVCQAASGSVGVGGGTAKPKDREILVQHLLVKEDQLQLLLEIQRQITQDGLDLSDLAAEHSTCPSNVEGGMIGWVALGQTDPAFEEAAFSAPVNKLVRVKTKHGWHLLQVLGERQAMKLEQIQAEEFHERMQNPSFMEEAQLIDVREPDEISTASIKGFEAYPLSRFGQWAPNITDDLDPEKDTYVLCHHGMRSMQAAQWLQTQGFRRLYNIVGGIHAYSKKVDQSIPTY